MLHEKFMAIALNLARRGIGQTAPNPSVACVIVKNGIIISTGVTAKGGRPHAESAALQKAGAKAKGANIYVTLEPCAHHGKTPPCASALIKVKPAEVIVACLDPDKRVNGRGIKMLAESGIKVTLGVSEAEALKINTGFFKRIKTGLPYVTLKAATSRDGKYLEGSGEPVWVTGEAAKRHVHLMRSRADALITGTGTVLADNPKLDVRLPGLEDLSPKVVVIGGRKIPKSYNIYKRHPAFIARSGSDGKVALDPSLRWDDNFLEEYLQQLGSEGNNNVMIESGPTLANAFIAAGLVDELVVIESRKILGNKGADYFSKDALAKFKLVSTREIGDDLIKTFRP